MIKLEFDGQSIGWSFGKPPSKALIVRQGKIYRAVLTHRQGDDTFVYKGELEGADMTTHLECPPKN